MRYDGKMFHSQITQIHVHQTLQRIQDRTNSEYKTRIVVTTPKSACSIRTIPVPHGLMTILTAHKASSTGYILTNSDIRIH